MRSTDLPLPSFDLAVRVGQLEGDDEQEKIQLYLAIGEGVRADVLDAVGPGFDWSGKRLLDFGCGAGRLLRHFAPEAEAGAELIGCDIDAPSIEWLREKLSPPVAHAFANGFDPPLDLPDGHVDVVVAASVFTHLAENWADWLVELHRVLKPGGILIASFLGRGAAHYVPGEEWDEDRVGMNVIGLTDDWERVAVLHSEWWLRAHWGRAFEIERVEPVGFGCAGDVGHGFVVARAREREPVAEELVSPEPGEPRELAAALNNVRQLRIVGAGLLAYLGNAIEEMRGAGVRAGEHLAAVEALREQELDELGREIAALRSERDELREALRAHRESRSWRLTRPLRAISRGGRGAPRG